MEKRLRLFGRLRTIMLEPQEVIGQIIREFRERRQLSQESLSALSGLSRPYIGEIECGEVNPSFSIILAIARGLGVKPSEIIEEYERRTANK